MHLKNNGDIDSIAKEIENGFPAEVKAALYFNDLDHFCWPCHHCKFYNREKLHKCNSCGFGNVFVKASQGIFAAGMRRYNQKLHQIQQKERILLQQKKAAAMARKRRRMAAQQQSNNNYNIDTWLNAFGQSSSSSCSSSSASSSSSFQSSLPPRVRPQNNNNNNCNQFGSSNGNNSLNSNNNNGNNFASVPPHQQDWNFINSSNNTNNNRANKAPEMLEVVITDCDEGKSKEKAQAS